MTSPRGLSRESENANLLPVGEATAREFASELIERAADDQSFDARALLAEHPELRNFKSVAMNLIYEEYCRRIEAGERFDPYEFAARFPGYQTSLLKVISVHDYADDHFADRDQRQGDSGVPWPRPGEPFLGFSLREQIGWGAFSRVFSATEPALGDRPVVVKVCTHGSSEARTLGQLEHSHIVPVFSVQTDETTRLTAICMPFLSRATLSDVLDRAFAGSSAPQHGRVVLEAIRALNGHAGPPCPAPPSHRPRPFARSGSVLDRLSYVEAVVHLGLQLTEALAHTHRHGICHCDIKPSNVLLTDDGKAMLFDFNLAFAEQVAGDQVGGTLPYMAPEQLRAVIHRTAPLHLDSRTDIFAFGVTLYQLLCGELPFGRIPPGLPTRARAGDLLERQRLGPQPIETKDARIDRSLSRLLERCLAFDPSRRPASAAELAAALRAELSWLRRTARWVQARRRTTAGAACLSLAMGAVAAGSWMTSDPHSVREFKRGQAAGRQEQYDRAIAHFTRALDSAPDCPDTLFARGRSYMHSGRFADAFRDFRSIPADMVDGRVTACIAYCMANLAKEEKDRKLYRKAIRFGNTASQEGFLSAAVFNNIGYCHLRLGEHEVAESLLKKAISLDDQLQAAYYNLAVVDRIIAEMDNRLPEMHYIQKALEFGPPTADLYLDAACIHAWKRNVQELKGEATGPLQPILEYSEEAVALGIESTKLKYVASFYPALEQNVRFQALMNASPPSVKPASPTWLVAPLPHPDEAVTFQGRPGTGRQ